MIKNLFRNKKEKKNSDVFVLGQSNSRPEIKTPQEVIDLINKKKIKNAEKYDDLQVLLILFCFYFNFKLFNTKIPGNIMYIYKKETKKSKSFLFSTLFDQFTTKSHKYESKWVNSEEFKEIILTETMIIDHFPNNVYNALHNLEKSICDKV